MSNIFRAGAAFLGSNMSEARSKSLRNVELTATTSPFAKLTIGESDISLNFFNVSRKIMLDDINSIHVSKTGYIVFSSVTQSFAFSSLSINKIVSILKKKKLEVDTKNVKIANIVIALQVLVVLAILVLVAVNL